MRLSRRLRFQGRDKVLGDFITWLVIAIDRKNLMLVKLKSTINFAPCTLDYITWGNSARLWLFLNHIQTTPVKSPGISWFERLELQWLVNQHRQRPLVNSSNDREWCLSLREVLHGHLTYLIIESYHTALLGALDLVRSLTRAKLPISTHIPRSCDIGAVVYLLNRRVGLEKHLFLWYWAFI